MWIGYFYLPKIFSFNVMETNNKNIISEQFCTSSIQCLLYLISYGTRGIGGIADNFDILSYKTDFIIFIKKLLYDVLFYLIIIVIIGNLFIGVIVDSIIELNEIYFIKENEKNNICFICQLNKDECISRGIDFDSHVKSVHNKWNYVYFLTRLYTTNPKDFTGFEHYVSKKVENKDIGWLPIEKVMG